MDRLKGWPERLRNVPADRLSGTALLLLALAYGVGALRVPEAGPRLLPLVYAVLLAALSVGILVAAGRRPAAGEAASPTSDPGAGPWLAALATVAYAALFEPLGFVVSTVVYATVITRLFTRGAASASLTVVAPLGLTAALYAFFRLALGVRLPPGLLG